MIKVKVQYTTPEEKKDAEFWAKAITQILNPNLCAVVEDYSPKPIKHPK